MNTLLIVNIAPWREAEMLEELAFLCHETGVTDVGFMAQAHPEMPPYLEKIRESTARFARMQRRLAPEGLRCGILLQQTIGHLERNFPPSPAPFQRIVGADGQVCQACCCPLDGGFGQHLADAVTLFAQADPAFLLVDDDFRLEWHQPAAHGCLCPRHLAEFAAITGRAWTREELLADVARDDETGLAVRQQWQAHLDESLLQLARRMRQAIDAVNPALRCGFCSVSLQRLMHERVARAFAGGTRPWLRFNSAYYGENGFKYFPAVMARLAQQQARVADDVETMSEADTCPHTRHSLSATSLRAYIIGGALLGMDMPKLWITNTWDWRLEQAQVYRTMLAASRQFFEEARQLGQRTTWQGPVALCTGEEVWRGPWSTKHGQVMNDMGWGSICGRLGIPFRTNGDGVVMLEGNAPQGFTDDELKELLAGGVLLDGPAAQQLSTRGFDDLLGVRATSGAEMRISLEQFDSDEALNADYAGIHRSAVRTHAPDLTLLTPVDSSARAVSWLLRWPWHLSEQTERVAPALTVFENRLGGRVAVYAYAVPPLPDTFLNEARKVQLCHLLGWLGRQPLPIVVESDGDVYALHGTCDDESVVAIFNLSPDPISPLRLHWAGPAPRQVRALDDDGAWRPHPVVIGEGTLCLDISLPTMRPLLLRIAGGDHG